MELLDFCRASSVNADVNGEKEWNAFDVEHDGLEGPILEAEHIV
jgi:hypothetical protein